MDGRSFVLTVRKAFGISLYATRFADLRRNGPRACKIFWRFSSVISVGSHEGTDSWEWYANPDPPVEFFARGIDIDVAWAGGNTLRCTGNSFAAPHIAGLSALVLSKHPGLTPFQLKSVLYLTASNTGGTT